MDYYYALLNSYSLLKKRKFKLSIQEQEEEGPDEEKTKEQVAQVMAAAGDSKDANQQLGGVLLYKDTLDGVPNSDDIMARDFADKDDPKSQSAQVVKGGVKNEKMKPIGHTFWSMMFPGEEAPQDEPSAEDDDAVEFQVDPEEQKRREALAETQLARDALGKELAEILEELGIEFDPRTLEITVENTVTYTSIPVQVIAMTLEGIASILRLGKKVKLRRGDYKKTKGLIKLKGEYQDLITKYKLEVDPDTGQLMFDTVSLTGFTAEKLEEAIEDMKRFKVISDQILGMASEFPAVPSHEEERTEKLENLRGVAVENLEVFTSQNNRCWELGGDEKSECIKKMHGQIIFALDERAALEKAAEDCKKIDPGKFPTTEKVLAHRQCVEKVNRMPQGISLPELVNVFRVGLLAKEDKILLDAEGKMSAATVKWIIKRLQETTGMNEEQATEYVKEVAEIDDDGNPIGEGQGLKALLLMSAITRHFAQQINGDMTPTIVLPMGQGQEGESNIIGAKVDVAKGYCPGEGQYKDMDADAVKKALVDHVRDNLLSDEQIEHYTKDCRTGTPMPAKTAAQQAKRKEKINKIIGDNLIGDPQEISEPSTTGEDGKEKAGDVLCAEGYRIQTDPKTHSNSKDHSTLGQTKITQQTQAFKELCGDGGDLKDNEKERLKQVKKTMEKCSGAKSIKSACKFKDEVDKVANNIETLLTPGNFKGNKREAKALMREWVKSKTGIHKTNAQNRMNAALRCFENPVGYEQEMTSKGEGYKAKSDCDHLKSIQDSIRNRQVAKLLDSSKNLDKTTGKLRGDAKAYFQTMYLITGGSNGEIMQDKRGLEDNVQETMMRNAEQEANLNGSAFVRTCKEWGTPLKDGTKRCKKWSQVVVVQDPNESIPGPGSHPENRANIAFDRGDTKVRTGTNPDIYHVIGDQDTAEEKARTKSKANPEGGSKPARKKASEKRAKLKAAAEKKKTSKKKTSKKKTPKKKTPKKKVNSELFTDYLEGQQKLLEVLLNQTTKNPNT